MTINTQAQKERFENFIGSQDLIELGRRYFKMIANDAKDGRYTPFVWLGKVLKKLANVEASMYYPEGPSETWNFYRSILEAKITKAYLDYVAQEVGSFS